MHHQNQRLRIVQIVEREYVNVTECSMAKKEQHGGREKKKPKKMASN
jgi:hypothetical protein